MGRSIKHNLANLMNFSGRDSRPTFWWWFLFLAIIYIVINLTISRLAIYLEGRMRRSKQVADKDDGSAAMHEGGAEAARHSANTGYGTGGTPGP